MLKGFVGWWFHHSQDLLSGVGNGGGMLFWGFLSDIVVYIQIVSIVATLRCRGFNVLRATALAGEKQYRAAYVR